MSLEPLYAAGDQTTKAPCLRPLPNLESFYIFENILFIENGCKVNSFCSFKVQISFKGFKGTDESAISWSLYFDCHGLNTKAYQNTKNSKINKIKSNKHHFVSNKAVFPHRWGRCASNVGGWRLAS